MAKAESGKRKVDVIRKAKSEKRKAEIRQM
jgi:hypothetical protein